jgi:hypothetical protein
MVAMVRIDPGGDDGSIDQDHTSRPLVFLRTFEAPFQIPEYF